MSNQVIRVFGPAATAIAVLIGCGTSSARGARSSDGGGGSPEGGALPSEGGGVASCAPTIPTVAWTSPYAGWSKGLPTDPTFFPISAWLQQPSHAMELSQIGVNVFLGNNADTDPLMASDLAGLKALGMYAIVGQDSVGLANIADPTIVAWWMSPDEPDNAQSNGSGGYGPPVAPSTLITEYNTYKGKDPNRPLFLGLGQGVAFPGYEGRGSNAPAESGYVPASDIIDFDIYPYNNCGGDPNDQMTCGQFWLNAFGVDQLHQWSNRNQAVWTDIETTSIGPGTTAGPTPIQTKSEVWLALIHGANGITYFIDSWNPSFREDAIFETPAMVAEVTAVNQQIKSLSPELNSGTIPNLVTVTSHTESDGGPIPVDTMVKAAQTSLYVFSAIARPGTTTASFAIRGLTGNGVVNVVGENRTIPLAAGGFSDSFAANDVHIYSIDFSTVTCH